MRTMNQRTPSIHECIAATRPKVRVFEFRWPRVDPKRPDSSHMVPDALRGERIKDALFHLPGIFAIDGFYSNVVRLTFHADADDGHTYTDDDYRFLIAAAVATNWGDPDQ